MILNRNILFAAALLAMAPALGAAPAAIAAPRDTGFRLPQPDTMQTLGYRAIYDALDAEKWGEAKTAILALPDDDAVRHHALAEMYLAKNSPRTDLVDLLAILDKAPWLPQAERLASLARKRGATTLPGAAQTQRLMWTGGSPQRAILSSIKGDAVADSVAPRIRELIRKDDPAGAEALLIGVEANMGNDARTEWRQRIAWSYYIENDDANARRVAATATAYGSGPFVAPAHWVLGLANWRLNDFDAASAAFAAVAANATDNDMRAAGSFWAGRAVTAAAKPQLAKRYFQAAAKFEESFYGLLARETLGLPLAESLSSATMSADDWAVLKDQPNVRIAVTLKAIGRDTEADDVLRFQATLSDGRQHRALVHLSSALALPTTQLWLAQRSTNGERAPAYTRYPMPNWKPANGWRVDSALVYAHTLQESRFRADAVSPAGARGLMQVMPGTASDMAAQTGDRVAAGDLRKPAVNLEYGQRFLERLRDLPATDGLLPKVMAAYNAGPKPIERWRAEVRDNGDPLLYIESLPYYETRAYVNIVMRNYWMYQLKQAGRSEALSAMAQGLWVRFPGMKGSYAVRIGQNGTAYGAD